MAHSLGFEYASRWPELASLGLEIPFELVALLEERDRQLEDYLSNRPRARVHDASPKSLNNSVFTALTFDSERYDVGKCHDTVINNGRLTAPINGLYTIGGAVRFESNTTGFRVVRLRVNNAITIIRQVTGAINGTLTMSVVTDYELLAGDFVVLEVFQNSGGNLDSEVSARQAPEFWMRWNSEISVGA